MDSVLYADCGVTGFPEAETLKSQGHVQKVTVGTVSALGMASRKAMRAQAAKLAMAVTWAVEHPDRMPPDSETIFERLVVQARGCL